MENSVELIKEFGTIPIGGALAFLLWKLISLVSRLLTNHMDHLQKNTEIIKEGIGELRDNANKTLFHLEQQTDLLRKISEK